MRIAWELFFSSPLLLTLCSGIKQAISCMAFVRVYWDTGSILCSTLCVPVSLPMEDMRLQYLPTEWDTGTNMRPVDGGRSFRTRVERDPPFHPILSPFPSIHSLHTQRSSSGNEEMEVHSFRVSLAPTMWSTTSRGNNCDWRITEQINSSCTFNRRTKLIVKLCCGMEWDSSFLPAVANPLIHLLNYFSPSPSQSVVESFLHIRS